MFVGRDVRLGRRVVVKVLHPKLVADLSSHRFEREIRFVARLQHPHIVPLLSAGEVDGLPYYTMPYVDGESLRERLTRDGKLSIASTVRLLRELADALSYAHAQGVVHRDLKPENVLISGGHAVIVDFGIAKALSRQSGIVTRPGTTATGTSVGVAVGTPAYMAPEQVAADPAVDHRADLYALGLIAYEAVAGAHPFAGRQPHSILAAHLTATPAPLADRRPDVPAVLAALVSRLLAKRPEDRPQSAEEVSRSLDGLGTGEIDAAAGPISIFAARIRRARRSTLLAAAGVVIAGGAILATLHC
jgi:serine/threonine-protein kinase